MKAGRYENEPGKNSGNETITTIIRKNNTTLDEQSLLMNWMACWGIHSKYRTDWQHETEEGRFKLLQRYNGRVPEQRIKDTVDI